MDRHTSALEAYLILKSLKGRVSSQGLLKLTHDRLDFLKRRDVVSARWLRTMTGRFANCQQTFWWVLKKSNGTPNPYTKFMSERNPRSDSYGTVVSRYHCVVWVMWYGELNNSQTLLYFDWRRPSLMRTSIQSQYQNRRKHNNGSVISFQDTIFWFYPFICKVNTRLACDFRTDSNSEMVSDIYTFSITSFLSGLLFH